MSKELIFSNQEYHTFNEFAENALEELQSLGIANPDNFEIRLRVRFWTDCNWEIISSELNSLFDYSDKWLVQIQEISSPENNVSYEVIETWKELESIINCDSDYFAIYDVDDELEIDVTSGDVQTRYTIRKLNSFGQYKLENEKNPSFQFFSLNLWEHFTVLAYFSRFRNGETVTFKSMDGYKTTMEVRGNV